MDPTPKTAAERVHQFLEDSAKQTIIGMDFSYAEGICMAVYCREDGTILTHRIPPEKYFADEPQEP